MRAFARACVCILRAYIFIRVVQDDEISY
eukprot:SAG11_NODE_9731_length_885_cov_0.846056_2_plen_28_part_01